MIEVDRVSFWYDPEGRPVLDDVDVFVDEGELVLVAGRTGSGKSTLLGTLNGLVPHFTGGHLEGEVRIGGVSTRRRAPRELSHLIGWVGQDPLAGFVTDTVEDELAYGMEQLGVPAQVMRRRVEETLDLLGIAELRRVPLRTLSGGQQQRVAIGSVLTMHPPVLVLDEPTSALDPTAAEDVLATLARLVSDLGATVVVAEHRMERVVPFADRMLLVEGDGSVRVGEPAEVLATGSVAPPIARLGRLAGWDPLPMSVRDARRAARGFTDRLNSAGHGPGRPAAHPAVTPAGHDPVGSAPGGDHRVGGPTGTDASVGHDHGARVPALVAQGVVVRYGPVVAVRGVDLCLYPGQVVAMMGRNGSGKSSLLWALQGSGPCQAGEVRVGRADPRTVAPDEARRLVGLVPQTAGDLLYLETVAAECAAADHQAGSREGSCRGLLDRLAPDIDPAAHPRDLSEGQRLALVIAVQLSAAPQVMLLDEPTRGLDYAAKSAFTSLVRGLAAAGRAVVVATHDVELVAESADRVVVLAEGEVVTDGPTVPVLCGSPSFSPQVTKILGEPWLTVDQVAAALGHGTR